MTPGRVISARDLRYGRATVRCSGQTSLILGVLMTLSSACSETAKPPVGPAGSQKYATLLVRGGEVMTMESGREVVEAVAVRGEVIAAIGSAAELAGLIGPDTRIVELGGHTATPGLVDGHCHLYGLGTALESVALRGSKRPEEAAGRAARAASERAPGEWVTGRGWDQNLWTPAEFPTRELLDRAVADRPVALRRIDGHALWANTNAIQLAGITRDTEDPPGGRIVRDARGEPTGVFIDTAMELIEKRIPAPDRSVRKRRILRAAAEATANGFTGVHEMGIGPETVAVYRELAASGELPLRVYAYLAGDGYCLAALGGPPEYDQNSAFFTVRGMKFFADGALGSRGAALLEPYADDPKNRGLWISEPEKMKKIAILAAESGWQLAIHAIGDAANRAVLDAYAAAIAARPDADLRFRVEHAQVLSPNDLPRFAKLEVLASMQPTHATSDMPWAEARLGAERIRGAYAWRTLLDSGAHIVAGSDFPVEEVSPLLGLHAAVTRQDARGRPAGGWYPDQRMTLAESLRAFTVEPAFAAFADKQRGKLLPGYAADITVYDRKLSGDSSLLKTHVAMTIVGGRVVYERK